MNGGRHELFNGWLVDVIHDSPSKLGRPNAYRPEIEILGRSKWFKNADDERRFEMRSTSGGSSYGELLERIK